MSYRIGIYTKRKGIPIFILYIITEKRAKLQSHIASLKIPRTHIACFKKMGPHIATRNSWSHIASHALVTNNAIKFWKSWFDWVNKRCSVKQYFFNCRHFTKNGSKNFSKTEHYMTTLLKYSMDSKVIQWNLRKNV